MGSQKDQQCTYGKSVPLEQYRVLGATDKHQVDASKNL